jgi:hypothetical protein
MDGLLFSDHTPTPAMTVVRNAYAHITVKWSSSHRQSFIITNLFHFVWLEDVVCMWRWMVDGLPTTDWRELSLPRILSKET